MTTTKLYRWHETRQVTGEVSEAPRRPVPRNTAPRDYQPTYISVEWKRDIENDTWGVYQVEIRGPIIKKDGQLSDAVHADESWRDWFGRPDDVWASMPDWALSFCIEHQPIIVSADKAPYTIEGCEHCAGCGEGADECVCGNDEDEECVDGCGLDVTHDGPCLDKPGGRIL